MDTFSLHPQIPNVGRNSLFSLKNYQLIRNIATTTKQTTKTLRRELFGYQRGYCSESPCLGQLVVAAKRFASKQLKVHKAHAVAKFLVQHLEPLCFQSVLLLKSLQFTSVYQA